MSLKLTPKRKENKYTLLLDGGLITYRIGFACQKKDEEGNIVPEPIENCLHSVKIFIQSILDKFDTEKYRLFISGDTNFRLDIDPEYKAGRGDKPYHYDNIRKYLIEYWNAEIVEGYEEDDKMAMEQVRLMTPKPLDDPDMGFHIPETTPVIVTQDKDLKMVPGWNYNPIKDELVWITEEQGMKWFWTQMLIGDTVDNIKGVHGLGPKKAEKILSGCDTFNDMRRAVGVQYAVHFDDPEQEMWKTAGLLWMCRTEDDVLAPGQAVLGDLYG